MIFFPVLFPGIKLLRNTMGNVLTEIYPKNGREKGIKAILFVFPEFGVKSSLRIDKERKTPFCMSHLFLPGIWSAIIYFSSTNPMMSCMYLCGGLLAKRCLTLVNPSDSFVYGMYVCLHVYICIYMYMCIYIPIYKGIHAYIIYTYIYIFDFP